MYLCTSSAINRKHSDCRTRYFYVFLYLYRLVQVFLQSYCMAVNTKASWRRIYPCLSIPICLSELDFKFFFIPIGYQYQSLSEKDFKGFLHSYWLPKPKPIREGFLSFYTFLLATNTKAFQRRISKFFFFLIGCLSEKDFKGFLHSHWLLTPKPIREGFQRFSSFPLATNTKAYQRRI